MCYYSPQMFYLRGMFFLICSPNIQSREYTQNNMDVFKRILVLYPIYWKNKGKFGCFSLFEAKTSKKGNKHRVLWSFLKKSRCDIHFTGWMITLSVGSGIFSIFCSHQIRIFCPLSQFTGRFQNILESGEVILVKN